MSDITTNGNIKHDEGYRKLFSSTGNFLHFLKKYIGESWVEGISEEDLEQTNSDVDNAVVTQFSSTPHWWPLKSTSGSGSFKISVLPNFSLLLLLCAAVR
jgi:hypothetical protein